MGSRLPRALLVLLLVGACEHEPAAAPPPTAPRPTKVEVARAWQGPLPIERRYFGQVQPLSRAQLAVGASGSIEHLEVREGDRVQKGQLLVVVDPRLASADLEAARAAAQAAAAELEQAQRDAAVYEQAGKRLVPGVEIDRATARARTLDAQRQSQRALTARAKAQLSRHKVIAPFDGVVSARQADPGDWVESGSPVLEIVADRALEVDVRVEPDLLVDVGVGSAAMLHRGDASVAATVRAMVPALDPATRTVQLRLSPVDTPPWVLAGQSVDVTFAFEHEGDGVLVPRDALVPGVARTRIVKAVDGQAVPVLVEVLEKGVDVARVQSDELAVGDTVIVRGNDRVRSGAPIEVVH